MTVGSIVLHIGGCGGGDGMTGIQGLEKSVEDFERSWRWVELIATANQWNEEKKLAVIPALLRGKLLDLYPFCTSEERRDLVTMKKALSDRAGVTKDPNAYLSRFITGLSPSIAREVILRGTPDNIEDAVKKALDVERVMHYVEKQETEVMKQKNSGMIRHKRYWNKLLSGWKHWNQDCRVHAAVPTPQIGNATANVVIVEETARIPSRSSCIVSTTVQNGDALSGRVGILEPHDNIPSSLLVARSQNTVSKANVIAIQVTNTGHSETTLYKGTQIGIFSIEHCVMALDSESAGPVLDDTLPEIDLSNTDLTTEQSVELQKLIWEFRGIFASADGSLGRTSVTRHSIQTPRPPVREPLRRIPHFLKDTVSAEIKKMLNLGVIRESNSPWSSAVVMMRKKDNKWRFCVDYRKLNSQSQKDAYLLPRIDETLESLAGSKYFSTLDSASGYWQVEVEEADREKTAFSTRDRHYEDNVMPFGLTNAPATFQRLMQCVLSGLTYEQCLICASTHIFPFHTKTFY
ncbi:hypothetical protein EMCRGX_G008924 [Ephydatia muelleri]